MVNITAEIVRTAFDAKIVDCLQFFESNAEHLDFADLHREAVDRLKEEKTTILPFVYNNHFGQEIPSPTAHDIST